MKRTGEKSYQDPEEFQGNGTLKELDHPNCSTLRMAPPQVQNEYVKPRSDDGTKLVLFLPSIRSSLKVTKLNMSCFSYIQGS